MAPSSKSTKTAKGRSKSGWKGLKILDLEGLGEKIKSHFKWKHTPRPFQLEAIKAQLLRKDALIHAGTGSGKTAIVAGPYALKETEGMVTFLVSPLISLQEEQVDTFMTEFGLTAVAVNSTHGGCTMDVMRNICKGKWQIVIISPELILSTPFVSNVLKDSEMRGRILSIVVDEAHVVSHWGSGFRKKYGSLGILRAFVPKGTPMIAMSATLPKRVRHDVLIKLQYNQKDYIYLDMGNDRLNVSLAVRAMQHPMNSFRDLDFVIPKDIKEKNELPKTWIYVDSVSTGTDMAEYLYTRLPESFRNEGAIYNYNAVFSSDNRKQLMDLFREGVVRVLICSDAAGMGCNIPDIDMVIQWKLPSSVSSFVQRAGRAARGSDRSGVAVLLVEPSIYQADLLQAHMRQKTVEKKGKPSRGIRENPNYPKSSDPAYAQARGLLRGSHDAQLDTFEKKTHDIPIDYDAKDEGLHALVQTTVCRRRILRLIYTNEKQEELLVPCCDLCSPNLLDQVRSPPTLPSTRKSALKIGVCHEPTAEALRVWRQEIRTRDFKHALFPSSGILSDTSLENLASVGPIASLIRLEEVLGGTWEWFGKYGNELLDKLTSLSIPPMKPKPTVPRVSKRRTEDETVVAPVKRARTTLTSVPNQIVAPTPVNRTAPTSRALPLPTSTPQTPQHSTRVPYYTTNMPQALTGNPYSAYLQMGSSPYMYSHSMPSSSSSSPASFYTPVPYSMQYYYGPPTPSQPPQPPRGLAPMPPPDFTKPSDSDPA